MTTGETTMRALIVLATCSIAIVGVLLLPLLGPRADDGAILHQPASLSTRSISATELLGTLRTLGAQQTNERANGIHPNDSVRTAQYSFCGACTENADCGPTNSCCRGDCPAGQKKCYKVSTCP